jgi:hypothetical protein
MRQLCFRRAFILPFVTCVGFLAALTALSPVSAQAPTPAQAPKPAPPKPAAQADAKLPPAREIIDRHIREVGGRDAILAHSSMRIVGTASMPAAGLSGKLEIYHAKPNKFLQRVSFAGLGDLEEGFDGKVGWTTSALTGPILFEGKQLEERAFEAEFYDELKTAERYTSITTLERTTFEERPVYKVRLVKKTGGEDVEFYDIETGLKAGGMATRESPMGPMQGTTAYSDYKKFGVLRQPSTLKMTTLNVQMVMTIAALEYDTVDPAIFTPPPQIKALIK